MSNRNRQKLLERFFLDRFREGYAGFPQGEIKCSERPDFLVLGREQTIGIEVQEYARGSSKDEGSIQRRDGELKRRVEAKAITAYELRSSTPVLTWLQWNLNVSLEKNTVDKVANDVAEIVAWFVAQNDSDKITIDWEDLENSPSKNVVDSVRIMKLSPGTSSFFTSVEAGFVTVTPEELQKVIDDKNALADGYLEKCDTMWLLIVAEGLHVASTASLTDAARQHVYQSRFERVFFFDSFSRVITSLV